MSKFWSDYPVIENEIKEVKKLIEKNAKCKDKIIENSILELLNSGGKMIRPAFTITLPSYSDLIS